MEKLFELLDEPDTTAVQKIAEFLDGNVSICLFTPHKRTSSSSGTYYNSSYSSTSSTKEIALTAFHYALSKSKYKCARYLLQKEIRALAVFPESGNSWMHEVAKCDNPEFLEWFWSQDEIFAQIKLLPKVKIDQFNDDKFTPLMLTIKNQKNIRYIKAWDKLGADFSLKDEKDRSVLHLAIEAKNDELALGFIRSFPQLAQIRTKEHVYPLHLAAAGNHLEVILALLKLTPIEIEDIFYNTSLHHAAKFGHIPAMKLLLESGANANARNWERDTTMHLVIKQHAVYGEQLEAALFLLLSYGANGQIVNAKNKDIFELATELFPVDDGKRRQYKNAFDRHEVQPLPPQTLLQAAAIFKQRSEKQFNQNTHGAFSACLDQVSRPVNQAGATWFWTAAPNVQQQQNNIANKMQ